MATHVDEAQSQWFESEAPHPLAFFRSQFALKWGLRLISLMVVMVVWQWYGKANFGVAPPTEVYPALRDAISSGEILRAAWGTLQSMLLGYVIAAIIGIALGMVIAMSSWGRNTIEPLVNALYAAPMSTLIPVVGIYIGLGFRGRVFLVVVWAVFVIIVNTTTGFRDTPPNLIEMARSFKASRMNIFFKIVFPSAIPYVLVGLRLGVGRALRGAITAEFLLAITNIGQFLNNAGSTYRIPKLYAGIVFVILLGLVVMEVTENIEKRLIKWRRF